MINDEQTENIEALSGISEEEAIQTEIDEFLKDNESILQVEDTDGDKKKITFKESHKNKTEIVDGISIAYCDIESSSHQLYLLKGLKNGKYLFFSDEGNIYICNVTNNKIDGNVMEYNTAGELIFEGEYKNNDKSNYKSGKGKEYDNGKLIFEGEYENGERNGKGKEYDKNGNVIFEGEYKDGEKWKGKEHRYFRELLFEGEYENGEKLKGKEYDVNGKVIFEGEYRNDKRNGKGKEYANGRPIFEGEYENGGRNGKGKEYDVNGKVIFEGEYRNGLRWNGEGREYDENGNLTFEGEYQYGEKWKGKGKKYDENGNVILEGEYKDGRREGKCIEYDKNGKVIFVGEYKYGLRLNGEGREYDENGNLIFEGEYKDGKKWNGKGKEYDENGNLIFEGEYKDGFRCNGKVKEYDKNGNLIFEGEYKDGKKWKGQEYDKNRNVIFDGEYKDGRKWEGKDKIYINTKDGGCIEKECKYDEGKKDGYEVTYYDKKSVIIRKYKNGKAMEDSFYVNGEECSKFDLIDGDIYTVYTDSTKTNYKDTNVVVYGLTEETLSNTTQKIRDKFGEKTQLLIKDDLDHEPDENIKIAEGTDKLELFINFHGEDNLEEHPIYSRDIRPISKKVSNAIVSSNGQIKTLTIKLDNCYGRTYDLEGNDLKAELLKDIYTKAVEKAKEKGEILDLSTLPTILISGATIDSIVSDYRSINDTGKKVGYKRMAKKEYFLFNKENWKTVAKIIEKQNKSNENTIIKNIDSKEAVEKNIKEYREKNKDLICLFEKTDKANYRNLKGYYKNRDNINNKETKIENKKGNNIGNV